MSGRPSSAAVVALASLLAAGSAMGGGGTGDGASSRAALEAVALGVAAAGDARDGRISLGSGPNAPSSGERSVVLRPPPRAVAEAVVRFLVDRLHLRSLALVRDRTSEARTLRRALEERLVAPARLDLDLRLDASERALARTLERAHPDVLLLDGEPDGVRAALAGALAERDEPIVILPRGFGGEPPPPGRGRRFLLHYASPRCFPDGVDLAARVAGTGFLDFLAAAAFDAAKLLAAGGGDERPFHGPTGPSRLEQGRLDAPLGLFLLENGALRPHLPAPLADEGGGTASMRTPDPSFGPPFGAPRTAAFGPREKTQVVVFTFGEGAERTIDDDLALLGLSTRGRDPVLDRLVREEILARLLSVTATKFFWNADGTPRPGESLALSFTAFAPKKTAARAWRAVVGGDHEAAGGEAWPGRGLCRVYSAFIRRTIFQSHALDPPLAPGDLRFLDGSYRFGSDRAADLRSETIRALIHGYAGSMALTAAHEIGHLCGLGHITDDPRGIMNVEEGAGLDPRDGRFSAANLERLRRRLGTVGR